MFLCEHGSPIGQSVYDLKLKAPAEQKEILFMSGNDLANHSLNFVGIDPNRALFLSG